MQASCVIRLFLLSLSSVKAVVPFIHSSRSTQAFRLYKRCWCRPQESQQWWCGLCCRRRSQWRRLLSLISGHTNKPACYICGKVISNVQNLYKHIRTIHQRQVSRCDYCGSVFRNAESARKHVLKMHRNDLSQGRGLSMVEPMVEPVVCGGWTPSTCTTSSPQIEQLHQHSMKSEDLT